MGVWRPVATDGSKRRGRENEIAPWRAPRVSLPLQCGRVGERRVHASMPRRLPRSPVGHQRMPQVPAARRPGSGGKQVDGRGQESSKKARCRAARRSRCESANRRQRPRGEKRAIRPLPTRRPPLRQLRRHHRGPGLRPAVPTKPATIGQVHDNQQIAVYPPMTSRTGRRRANPLFLS
jgi:hypothetical protein